MATPSQAVLTGVIQQLAEIETGLGDGPVAIGRSASLNVSSLSKVLFPDAGVTKGEVMRYYAAVAPYLLPVLKDRPLSLKRFPNGIEGKFFFQQKAPPEAPEPVRVETVISESGERQERLIGGSLATVIYCAQIGAFEFNPWNARVQSLEHPDFAIIDLDPGPGAPFQRVVEVALLVKEALDHLGLHGGVKTSGATGIHIGIPLPVGCEEAVVERVPRLIATAVAGAHPKIATVERALKQRDDGQVYVDFGQNSRGKTVASAYSVRAKPGATVSTPLQWDELTPELDMHSFTLRTVPDRIARRGDLWAAAMKRPNSKRIVTNL
ncbi:MAG: non-homologous end-joining DNA ligase [Gemmatimonadaceae bacterium]